jgi:hypothetical protein
LRSAALATLLLAASVATPRAVPQPAIDFDTAWFSPSLVEDRGPVCAAVLAFGRQYFAGDSSLATLDWRAGVEIAGLEAVDVGRLPRENDDPYIVIDDRKVYWLDTEAPGCGGACRQVYVTPTLPPPRPERRAWLAGLQPTPAAYRHRVFRAGDSYYVLQIVAEQLQLHEVTADATWQATCSVRLTPGALSRVSDPRFAATLVSLDALRDAVAGLMRGAGSCGTMQTHHRWAGDVARELELLVSRPRPPRPARPGDDSTYDIDMQNLERWALTGASEHAALARYKAQLETTTADLAAYYVRQYGVATDDADGLAAFGVREAVSAGVRFYRYSPFESESERQLRAAILERRSLAELRTIDVPLEGIDGAPTTPFEAPRESMLNVALGHPEALEYLLERGANPNSANPFGKTPLMYAAQQNALAATEMLLAAGADPNAATTWPEDRCYYTLQHASMTPLHYAVRYASPELVERLLDAGAAPYVRTQTSVYGAMPEYPLDWLRKYTAADAAERNPNIAADEVERLAALLAPPSPDRRAAIARDFAREAEALYAAGDVSRAYALLVRAQQADDSNARALSDLSLVALRAEQPGEAVAAALRLIEVTDDVALEANAWFNIGLACDRPYAEHAIRYSDTSVCRYTSVFPFLRAWELQPTAARARKLDEVFAARATCSRARGDGSEDHYVVANGVRDGQGLSSRVYAYHAASSDGFEGMTWSTYQNPTVLPATSPVARHVLGERAISVLETGGRFETPTSSAILECTSSPE